MNKKKILYLVLFVMLMSHTVFSQTTVQDWSDWIGGGIDYGLQSIKNYMLAESYSRTVLGSTAVAGLGYSGYKLYRAYVAQQKMKEEAKVLARQLELGVAVSGDLAANMRNIAIILDSDPFGHNKVSIELFKQYVCPVLDRFSYNLRLAQDWDTFLDLLVQKTKKYTFRSTIVDRYYLTILLNFSLEACPQASFYDSLQKALENKMVND